MKYPHFLFVAFFLCLSSSAAIAQNNHSIHVIIAVDRSSSLYVSTDTGTDDGYTSHAEILVTAFQSTLSGLIFACRPLTVSYFAWGTQPNDLQLYDLHDLESIENLTHAVTIDIMSGPIGNTNHLPAIFAAVEQAEQVSADVTHIVFITDERGEPQQTVPMSVDVGLTKISIRDPWARDFLVNKFLPGIGVAQHADSTNELEQILTNVFDSLPQFACMLG